MHIFTNCKKIIFIVLRGVESVLENSFGAKNMEVADPVDFRKIQKTSVKFTKIQPKRV
jgi:hypothetical protein